MKIHSKVTLHMVSSLDGYIARNDGSVSWLETSWSNYEKGQSGENPEEFLKTIGCYILGSRTYELSLELGWPYGEKPTFVVTNRQFRSERENVEFYSGDLKELINGTLKPKYENIWLVGGAMLGQECLSLGLVDEIRISIIPILLGSGLSFFGYSGKEWKLNLKDVTAYKDGMVEVWYEVNPDQLT